jgi:hypothetical protein
MEDNTLYLNAITLDWWHDEEFNEYIVIVEMNKEWRVLFTKVV